AMSSSPYTDAEKATPGRALHRRRSKRTMRSAGRIFQWKILCIHDRQWEAEAKTNQFLAKAPRKPRSRREQTLLASFASLAPCEKPLNPFAADKFQLHVERRAADLLGVGVHVIKEGVEVGGSR